MTSRKPKSAFTESHGGVGGSAQIFQFSDESRAELLAAVDNGERGEQFVDAIERTLDDYHLQLGMDRGDRQRTSDAFASLDRISNLLHELSEAVRESEGYGYGFLVQALYNEDCRPFLERHPSRVAYDLERYGSAVQAFKAEHDGRESRRPRQSADDSFWREVAYLYRSMLDRHPGTGEKSPFVNIAALIAKHGAVHELRDMRGKLRSIRKRSAIPWGEKSRG